MHTRMYVRMHARTNEQRAQQSGSQPGMNCVLSVVCFGRSALSFDPRACVAAGRPIGQPWFLPTTPPRSFLLNEKTKKNKRTQSGWLVSAASSRSTVAGPEHLIGRLRIVSRKGGSGLEFLVCVHVAPLRTTPVVSHQSISLPTVSLLLSKIYYFPFYKETRQQGKERWRDGRRWGWSVRNEGRVFFNSSIQPPHAHLCLPPADGRDDTKRKTGG